MVCGQLKSSVRPIGTTSRPFTNLPVISTSCACALFKSGQATRQVRAGAQPQNQSPATRLPIRSCQRSTGTWLMIGGRCHQSPAPAAPRLRPACRSCVRSGGLRFREQGRGQGPSARQNRTAASIPRCQAPPAVRIVPVQQQAACASSATMVSITVKPPAAGKVKKPPVAASRVKPLGRLFIEADPAAKFRRCATPPAVPRPAGAGRGRWRWRCYAGRAAVRPFPGAARRPSPAAARSPPARRANPADAPKKGRAMAETG